MSSADSELLVSLFFHNMPASLLQEFASRIVKPYFDGNMNAAIRALMDKALIEEELFQGRVDNRRGQL